MLLDTHHIDYLGPLSSTKKSYNHIFLIVDAFSKFAWRYAMKTINAAKVLNILKKQSIIFENPYRIILDRGASFMILKIIVRGRGKYRECSYHDRNTET